MRDFFKYTLASFVGLVLFVVLGMSGLFFLLLFLSVATKDAGPRVEDKSILTLNLGLEITDSTPTLNPGDVLGDAIAGTQPRRPIALRTVLNGLEAAAEDDRIVGLYLYGNINPQGIGSGFAAMTEVRQALVEFAESGKPIYAYEVNWAERDYYLVSLADTIALNPSGLVELNGFRSEQTFFAGALEKYGIGVQPVRVGRYKSAVEPFTRSDRSPEEREQTQKLLGDLWSDFLTRAADSRQLTPQQLQAIADDQGLLLADEAEEFGLVDQVTYLDELIPQLQELTGEEKDEENEDGETQSFRQINIASYADAVVDQPATRNQVALVFAEGDIVSGEGNLGQVGGDSLARQLRDLRQDKAVKAVVLRVNSPGGSATASEQIAREVLLTTKVKPVVVSMGSYAASGGYQISAYADRIFASPTTITGSIGVFGLLPNVQEIANRNGITWDVVKTGRLADGDTIARPKTPEELAIIQRVVDRIYQQFVAMVAESRSLPPARVAEIAQGRVWSGVEAERLGLVDELGGLEDAIQAAVKQAKLGEDWRVEEYPKARSLEAQILENVIGNRIQAIAPRDPLSLELQKIQADLAALKALNDPIGVYSRLPFLPQID